MSKLIYPMVVVFMLCLFATYAYGQTSTPIAMQPFAIKIGQSVPVSAIISVDNITRTVPLTLNVDININIESPVSFTVGSVTTPTVNVVPDGIDQFGIPYSVQISDPALTITEWTAFANLEDTLVFAGELHLAPDAEPVNDIVATVRIFGHTGTLIDVDNIYNLAFRLVPGGYVRFEEITDRMNPADVGRYIIDMKVVR